jgi:hypothetical protein
VTDQPMMKCGHAANATSGGKPACAICMTTETATTQPDLTGRVARCSYPRPGKYGDTDYKTAHTTGVPSSTNLPFFAYQPDLECDSFYCGCWGWD